VKLLLIDVIQCDEKKPICTRCEKGSRECSYPPPLKKKRKPPLYKRGKDKEVIPEKETTGGEDLGKGKEVARPSTSGSESSVVFEPSDDENEEEADSRVLVRFCSSSTHDSPESDSSPDHFTSLQFDQQMLIDSLGTPSDTTSESLILPPSTPLFSWSISGVSPGAFCEELLMQTPPPESSTSSTRLIHIPRPPKTTRTHPVQFFLSYHKENITSNHYFSYYDYKKICTTMLLAMAERSEALRHAVVAFSALIYSLRIDRTVREQAFIYYAIALQELGIVLRQHEMTVDESHIAIATALQLSGFDVPLRLYLF